MAKVKKENYEKLTLADLNKLVNDLKSDLREMRFNRVLGSNFNLVDFRVVKKKLARVLTALRQKEISASLGGE